VIGPLVAFPAIEPAPSKTLIVVDSGVPERHDERLLLAASGPDAILVRLAGGERRKSIDGWRELLEAIAAERLDRDALLVAAGGGALGDAVGFAAATWHRGIRWGTVPTTLVAMIDASIGGKTALDLGGVKNQIGAFWWPEWIAVDPAFLATLPARELRAGWGELIKTALIGDVALFEALERDPPRAEGAHRAPRSPTRDELARAIAVKRRIVAEDPREADRRRVLNLGHTLGHALEALPGNELAHGEAVSAGLVFAAELAADLGRAPRALAGRIAALLAAIGLPERWPTDRVAELLPRLAADKKNRGGRAWFALLRSPGEIELAPVDPQAVLRRLAAGRG
jgi:3-dehydroquinate synthase